MKKINNNNRFRNNNNGNSIYSLNYKFDSISVAGKFTGTALDLIKRYNELAKEAQSRGDYVDMEVFRQYAEHYRKIVTEINARKNQTRENNLQNQSSEVENTTDTEENQEQQTITDNNLVETQAAPREQSEQTPTTAQEEKKPKIRRLKRGFTVVEVTKEQAGPEISANENEKLSENTIKDNDIPTEKPKRRRLTSKKNTINENISAEKETAE